MRVLGHDKYSSLFSTAYCMENPARASERFMFHRWSIKVSLVHHRHPNPFQCRPLYHPVVAIKVKACFQRLYFPKRFPKRFRRRLMNISEDASPTRRDDVRYRPFYRRFKSLPNFALTARGTCNLDDGARRRATLGKTRGEKEERNPSAFP